MHPFLIFVGTDIDVGSFSGIVGSYVYQLVKFELVFNFDLIWWFPFPPKCYVGRCAKDVGG